MGASGRFRQMKQNQNTKDTAFLNLSKKPTHADCICMARVQTAFQNKKQQMWLKNGILPFCLFTWGILLIVVAWTISTTIWYLILKTVGNKGEEREEKKKNIVLIFYNVFFIQHT